MTRDDHSMAGTPINPALQFVRGVAAACDPSGDPDRLLLERFVNEADGNAFQVLIRRHGPLVMSVCTRVLGNEYDAEDAFQATFLVLVRKARSLRAPESLAPWLYGVAYRTSLKAKADALKRRARRTTGGSGVPTGPGRPGAARHSVRPRRGSESLAPPVSRPRRALLLRGPDERAGRPSPRLPTGHGLFEAG